MDKVHSVSESISPDHISGVLAESLESLSSRTLSQVDVLSLAFHSTLIESGFFLKSKKNLEESSSLNSEWRTETQKSVRLFYGHKSPQVHFTLHSSGVYALFNILGQLQISDEEPIVYSLTIDTPAKYVLKSKDSVNLNFKELKNLIREFKNEILNPCLYDISLYEDTYPGKESFMSLPNELMAKIASFIADPKTLCILERTSRRLKVVFGSEAVWKRLFQRDYKSMYDNMSETEKLKMSGWKKYYIRNYSSSRISVPANISYSSNQYVYPSPRTIVPARPFAKFDPPYPYYF